jgi:hypothetical protein
MFWPACEGAAATVMDMPAGAGTPPAAAPVTNTGKSRYSMFWVRILTSSDTAARVHRASAASAHAAISYPCAHLPPTSTSAPVERNADIRCRALHVHANTIFQERGISRRPCEAYTDDTRLSEPAAWTASFCPILPRGWPRELLMHRRGPVFTHPIARLPHPTIPLKATAHEQTLTWPRLLGTLGKCVRVHTHTRTQARSYACASLSLSVCVCVCVCVWVSLSFSLAVCLSVALSVCLSLSLSLSLCLSVSLRLSVARALSLCMSY